MSNGASAYAASDMTSSFGIMTVTRTPCELDKMSLFQDLKLKRRKVDSRCSSDGESVADTSTSSPDIVCPPSPKIISSELTMATSARSPQSPDSLTSGGGGGTTDRGNPERDGSSELLCSMGEEPTNSSVFDGGGRRSSTPQQSVNPTPPPPEPFPSQTPPPQSVIRAPQQHCPPSPQQQTTVRTISTNHHQRGIKRSHSPTFHSPHDVSPVRCQQTPPPQSNAVNVINVTTSNSPQNTQSSPPISPSTPQQVMRQSPLHFISQHPPESPHSRQSPIPPSNNQQEISIMYNRQNSNKNENSSNVRTIQHSPSIQIKTEPQSTYLIRQSPLHILKESSRPQSPNNPSGVATIRHTPQSPIHNIRQSPVHLQISPTSLHIKQCPSSPVHHNMSSPRQSPIQHIQQGQPTSQSPGSPRRINSPLSRNTPGVITSQQAAVIQSQFWVQNTRINGVKPELIGGSFGATTTGGLLGATHQDMKPPLIVQRSAATTSPQIRPTPTVIMGEVGGVRTMIWSQPPSNLSVTTPQTSSLDPAQLHASTSSWSSSNSSSSTIGTNPEESAAQMLLTLGQDRSRNTPSNRILPGNKSQTSPSVSQQQQHTVVPLNMERLWAGDLSQLPANQQTQALNLSSSQQQQSINPVGSIMYLNRPNNTNDIKPQINATGMTTLLPDSGHSHHPHDPTDNPDEEDQPMICMICEDKATGLHYGIITCEGCKGFFKRTVQNRRVYTCVADGNCEITKAQRNRCQYCRFKKCIEQGMVLQAVREDRMPGGRNSGAVYNLYKVKYKKHKKTTTKQQAAQQQKQQQLAAQQQQHHGHPDKTTTQLHHLQQHGGHHPHGIIKTETSAGVTQIPAHLVNGTILKTALTNPSEVIHLRQRLDNNNPTVQQSNINMYHPRSNVDSIDQTLSMIQTLIDCDEFQDIATLHNIDELLDNKTDLSEKLCQIGDSIVYKLVQWTKRLPFYLELPVEVHTRLLTHKWHELLVLTTSAYQAIHGTSSSASAVTNNQTKLSSFNSDHTDIDFTQEVSTNLCVLQTCLTSMMGRPITMDQLRQDVGLMVEKITHVTLMFRRIRLTMHEYVCLKVITMLNQGRSGNGNSGNASGGNAGNTELETIQERYASCLRALTHHMHPQQPQRFQELLIRLPEIQSAAALLLESKMFYVPFLLNSAIQR
ncbi:hormone receptor 4 [Chrysoperla carnea]|uniref:hormone receptor 4 n=1 Tax=Chrysoperla carnea TaxID=189513 RepID=UPI001D084C83|nr:hormone receptor 4 [Chrysoperla carnea]